MIVNRLEPCCSDCIYIDIATYTEDMNDSYDRTMNRTVTIWCKHAVVCGMYNQSPNDCREEVHRPDEPKFRPPAKNYIFG